MPDDPDPYRPGDLDAEGFLSADAPPPWGTESRDERLLRLNRAARNLPPVPGVYLMKDAAGVVIYIGKATRLCDRVSSYFLQSTELGPRKNPMLDTVHSFDTLICETEWEALLAESRLIKDVKPQFNERQTDDKTFPYLVVTQREDFPRVFITRNPAGIDDKTGALLPEFKGARVFGPFTNSQALREAIHYLQQVFKFRTCSLDIKAGDPKNHFFRPCLLHAISQCTAPCNDSISPEAYGADIDRFVRFLGSRRSVMLRELRQEMIDAAAAMHYEKAAILRDQISAIEKLDQRASLSDQWQPEAEIGYVEPDKALRSLAKALNLDRPIRCIEGIDIAHLQGGETVGSKVCFIDGRPFRDQYRRYRIRSVEGGNDDYASIREVVSRRYREAGAGHELYPDVILIDGGLGQLHAAIEAFATLQIPPPMVISLAKKEELIYTQERSVPIRLGRNNAGLRLCQQIRDEAHRFAQHYHHILRRKKSLEE